MAESYRLHSVGGRFFSGLLARVEFCNLERTEFPFKLTLVAGD